jgi:hypothetical protein
MRDIFATGSPYLFAVSLRRISSPLAGDQSPAGQNAVHSMNWQHNELPIRHRSVSSNRKPKTDT